MHPIVTGLLGLFFLLLGPVLIAFTTTLMADMLGVLVLLIGLGLVASSIIQLVRRSPHS
ncbi:MAG TPA: hypothetical protein VGD69_07015 [Herpetosiphonaceae bacterium]